ncbi:hypothetical protein ACFROC_25770 [Nocardia tengchongensis]|uniref:hypothetical protein n=1 Tax=Nocardia tengchongensis TaxID=2055889 RepID=UPI0036BB388E
MADSSITDPSNIIATASFATAVGSAIFAGWQARIAKRALKVAELSADAAKQSAETSAALAEIEKARFHTERRPRWIAVVERPQDHSQRRLRLALDSGEVDQVVVEFPDMSHVTFLEGQRVLPGMVIESPRRATFGPVQEKASAFWRISVAGAGWINQPGVAITSWLGDSKWYEVILIKQDSIPASAFDEDWAFELPHGGSNSHTQS